MIIDKKLKDDVLNLIKPTENEKTIIYSVINKFIRRLKRNSKKLDLDVDFFIGGSFGKDTFLKTSSDIDIFARFDLKYENDSLSNFLESILKMSKIKFKKQKGSRDYFSYRYSYGGLILNFEIVPNYFIPDINSLNLVLNSTDVSPLHVDFLKKKFLKNENLKDEIRITKQFFKAKKLYGAESYINGFSGHSIDILVSYYGSFEALINAGKSWKEQEIIDVNNFYESGDEVLDKIGDDKKSNLILIDPIIKERNAARALDNENYCKFILLCNNIKKLEMDDFVVKKPNIKGILESNYNFSKRNNLKFLAYKVKFEIVSESEDIVGTKLLKIHTKLKKYFLSLDFSLFRDNFVVDIEDGICLMIFLFEKTELPKIKKIIGPSVFMKKAVDNFLKAHNNYFIENSKILIYEKRTVYKINDVSKFSIDDFKKLINNKDISFIKKIRIYSK